MDKKMRLKIMAVMVAFMFSVPGLYAGNADGQGPRQEQKEEMFEKIGAELGLTAKQSEQLKVQRKEKREERKTAGKEMRAKRKELKEELDKKEVDRAKVDTIISEISELQSSKLKEHVESILSIKEILTEEQFQKLRNKMKAKHGKKGSRQKGNRQQGGGMGGF